MIYAKKDAEQLSWVQAPNRLYIFVSENRACTPVLLWGVC